MFHRAIKTRTNKNRINTIQDKDGMWITDPQQVCDQFVGHLSEFMNGSKGRMPHLRRKIVNLGPVMDGSMSNVLNLEFNADEIKQAIWSIPNSKAPVMDGFGSCFFKKCWSTVGKDVVEAVQESFKSGEMLKMIDTTSITLVPKDLVRHYARKHAPQGCMLKIDIQKAYDTVGWGFFESLLHEFHFPHHFVKVIMACVTTAHFTLLINGTSHGFFGSNRGLKQGDPMSPLCFVLCVEYLTRTLVYVGNKSEFKFHPRCRSMRLNNLCFADDLMVFCKGEKKSVQLLIQGLKHFEVVSGLKANNGKSEIYSSGMTETEVQSICGKTGFGIGSWPFKYLGTPICNKRLSASDRDKLVQKIALRILSWKIRNISFAGRLQLVNSVLMSLCTYWMQFLIIPKVVVYKINQLCRKFLREGSTQGSKTGYVNLDKRLQVRERLYKHGISDTPNCCLCGDLVESHQHLFFYCIYVRQILQEVKHWLGIQRSFNSMNRLVFWLRRRKGLSEARAKVMRAALAAMSYGVWRARNQTWWHQKTPTVSNTERGVDPASIISYLLELSFHETGQAYNINTLNEVQHSTAGELVPFDKVGYHSQSACQIRRLGGRVMWLWRQTSGCMLILHLNYIVRLCVFSQGWSSNFLISLCSSITKESLNNAFENGITADQIRLWGSDLNRIAISPAQLYDEFPFRVLFESACDYAREYGALLWEDLRKMQRVVRSELHNETRWRLRQRK